MDAWAEHFRALGYIPDFTKAEAHGARGFDVDIGLPFTKFGFAFDQDSDDLDAVYAQSSSEYLFCYNSGQVLPMNELTLDKLRGLVRASLISKRQILQDSIDKINQDLAVL